MIHEEVITATGHEHVIGTHESTLEVTTDDWLTPSGDCIVGINATRSPTDFADAFVRACQDHSATITATITVGQRTERVIGKGHPDLSFDSERAMVLRTSTYTDDRTVMVHANQAATDVDRELIDALSDGASLHMQLTVGD